MRQIARHGGVGEQPDPRQLATGAISVEAAEELVASADGKERCTAADITNADPTMMTISSEKPLKAFFGSTMPSASAASNARIAVTS